MDSKDLSAWPRLKPPRVRRPPMSAAQALQLYLTIAGWLIWMVVVGYFGLRAPEEPLSVILMFSAVIAALTFIDLFGLWLVIGRWQAMRKERAKTEEKDKPPESGQAAPAPGPTPGDARGSFLEAIGKGIFRSMPGPPGRLWRQIGWLGVAAAAIAAAVLGTGLSGRPIFLPGTGTIKGAIAIALTLWIFMEPLGRDEGPKPRRGLLAARTGLGLGLLCFASDHFFPWFGAAGVVAGGVAAAHGKWGSGLYAAVISGAAWALQWWGVITQ